MNGWALVLIGGAFETVWSTTMNMSDGFTNPVYAILTLFFLMVSTWFLMKGMTAGVPVGTGYAVWVGIGAIGSVAVGMAVFGESVNIMGFASLAAIVAGVIGMNLLSSGDPQ